MRLAVLITLLTSTTVALAASLDARCHRKNSVCNPYTVENCPTCCFEEQCRALFSCSRTTVVVADDPFFMLLRGDQSGTRAPNSATSTAIEYHQAPECLEIQPVADVDIRRNFMFSHVVRDVHVMRFLLSRNNALIIYGLSHVIHTSNSTRYYAGQLETMVLR